MSMAFPLSRLLDETGSEITELVQKPRWQVEQAWREIYARATHRRTGKWRIHQFEWHVFSYGDAACVDGMNAIASFRLERPDGFYVWAEDAHIPLFQCSGGSHLPLAELKDDVHVFPLDLSWTMAFTHEIFAGLGPYFSRRQWQVP